MASRESQQKNVSPVEEDASIKAMQLGLSSVFPMTFQAAIELGLLDIISIQGSGTPISAKVIASRLDTNNPEAHVMVDRILRLLAAHGVITCTLGDDQVFLYRLTPVAKYFMLDRREMSLVHKLRVVNDKVVTGTWQYLKDAVLEGGIPFDKSYGVTVFEYLGQEPRFNELFNKMMVSLSSVIINAALENYEGFHNLKELVDVGGGYGLTLNKVVSKYPNIKAINFDLPHVIQHAPPYPGVHHVAGNMFENVPKSEAILLKNILHGWDDDRCLKILKNCYDAIPAEGKVIVIESLVPETVEANPKTAFLFQKDMLMMTQTSCGKERTEREIKSLAISAGFRDISVNCSACTDWVIELYK